MGRKIVKTIKHQIQDSRLRKMSIYDIEKELKEKGFDIDEIFKKYDMSNLRELSKEHIDYSNFTFWIGIEFVQDYVYEFPDMIKRKGLIKKVKRLGFLPYKEISK